MAGAERTRQSKEDKRFNRYDKNRDGVISRTEMLATRVNAFQKLDTNHDNLLSFEEWAVRTSNRFKEMDTNGDGVVSRAEFDSYQAAHERAKKPRCACGGARAAAAPAPEEMSGADGGDAGDPAQ